MKKILTPFLVAVIFAGTVLYAGTVKIVQAEKLTVFLPAVTPGGFTRSKPECDMQQTPPSSSVTIHYRKTSGSDNGEDGGNYSEIVITVAITDCGTDVEYLLAMLEPGEEWEKPWVYKKIYTGKRGGCVNEPGFNSCALAFQVNRRFLVTMECNGSSDLKILDTLVESMNLDALAKAR